MQENMSMEDWLRAMPDLETDRERCLDWLIGHGGSAQSMGRELTEEELEEIVRED